jgi:DNA primase
MANAGDLGQMVKQQADIVRVVSDYVPLKPRGMNHWGLCPFHQEKTPSFSVHAGRQWFHCFGCGKSGDVFTFVQQVENISFFEALRLIAQKLDIKLPKMQYNSEHEAEDAKLRAQLIEMHHRACALFEEQLRKPEAAQARQYLSGRGLTEEIVREFHIGFAPDSGFVLKDRFKGEYSEDLMRQSGLFAWKEGAEANIYSKFRNRIMFPIANDQGKVIAFTGRTLATDDKAGPKYLNSPETPLYSKSRVLFNLDKAKEAVRKLGYAIIVEGQMDCISVYSAGYKNVIASSGTAFSEAQVRLLGRFTKKVVVNFDPDTAGAAATDRSLGMLLEEDFEIRVLRLEAGFDPDLFIRKRGVDAYNKQLMQAPGYFDYLVERVLTTFPVRTPEGKQKAVNYLLPHVHRVNSRIVREALAGDIAQKLGIDSAVLRQEFRSAAASRGTPKVRATELKLSPAEKVLVRGASAVEPKERALRAMVLRALAEERLHEGMSSEALLQAILEAGEDVDDPMSLPLEEADRNLLAEIVMKESEPLTEELVESAIESLRHRIQIYRREREIKRGIVEAERSNDATALLRLKQEKLELDRKLAAAMS